MQQLVSENCSTGKRYMVGRLGRSSTRVGWQRTCQQGWSQGQQFLPEYNIFLKKSFVTFRFDISEFLRETLCSIPDSSEKDAYLECLGPGYRRISKPRTRALWFSAFKQNRISFITE